MDAAGSRYTKVIGKQYSCPGQMAKYLLSKSNYFKSHLQIKITKNKASKFIFCFINIYVII